MIGEGEDTCVFAAPILQGLHIYVSGSVASEKSPRGSAICCEQRGVHHLLASFTLYLILPSNHPMDIFQIPQLDYSTLMQELESRAFVSSSTGMGRRERKVALLKALQEVVGLINLAEAAKSAETSVKRS